MTRQLMTALAAAGLLVLGGCGDADDGSQVATAGGSSDTTSDTTSEPDSDTSRAPAGDQPVVDEQDQGRQFAQCMREHGVDMPDPDPNTGGKVRIGGPGSEVDKNTVRAALEACRQFMPNGGERRELTPEDLDKLRQFAQCMREHGIDMPDPDPNGGGITIRKDGDGRPDEAEMRRVEEAMEACRHLSPKIGPAK